MATEGATEPKPTLVQLFEAVTAIMELDGGLTRVELEFDGGHLRRWSAHDERNGAWTRAAPTARPRRELLGGS